MTPKAKKLPLFPSNSAITAGGHLTLGGHRAVDLAAQFGTPLYVYDVETIRRQIAAYRRGLARYPGPARLTYASKAFLCLALARLMATEGVGLDVASAGELFIARQGGADPAGMHLHGNNKTLLDLSQALEAGVGRIVVDNAAELELLGQLVAERQQPVNLWLRVTPGLAVQTHHRYTVTGLVDSKFGFPLTEAQAVAEWLVSRGAGEQGGRGAEEQGRRGAEGQGSKGAEEQRGRGAEEQRGRGARGQRGRGAEGQRGKIHPCTPAPPLPRTLAPPLPRTPAPPLPRSPTLPLPCST